MKYFEQSHALRLILCKKVEEMFSESTIDFNSILTWKFWPVVLNAIRRKSIQYNTELYIKLWKISKQNLCSQHIHFIFIILIMSWYRKLLQKFCIYQNTSDTE